MLGDLSGMKLSGLDEQKNLTDGAELHSSGEPKKTSSSSSSTPTKSVLRRLTPISEVLENVLKIIDSRTGKPMYPTGLSALDNLLWGLHKKELLIMGARTSQGKSSLALQLALNLASQGQRVAYFSLEMSKEQMVERMIAHHTKINNRALRHGLAKIQLKSCYDSLRKYSQGLKLLIDESGYTFDEIVEVCEMVPFDFVFIDYIQMVSIKGYRSKLDAIDEYVRKFKELCKVKDFGGIIVSQVNREGADSMGIQHLKGSGTLEEHPDTVLLLEWDWDKNEYFIRVEKQRHGECGKVEVCYEPEYFTFSDISGTKRVLSGQGLFEPSDRVAPPPFGYKD